MNNSPSAPNQKAVASASNGMSTSVKMGILVAVVIAIGGGLAAWKATQHKGPGFERITKAEMEALLNASGPMLRKQFLDNPAQKEQQMEGLKETLAIASAAYKELGSDPIIQRSLEIVEMVHLAQMYDQRLRKDAAQMPAFGLITEDQLKAFYGEGQAEGSVISAGEKNLREQLFEQFVETQLELAKRAGAAPADTKLTDEQKAQIRPEFAKRKIYEMEAREKIKNDPENWGAFGLEASANIKLRKADFLVRQYQPVMAEKMAVSDKEVDDYLAANPELADTSDEKAKAEMILGRVKAGEGFEALAKEFSDDEGSKENGGLYKDRTAGGGFDPKFEAAALGLEPGQVTEALVETQFGFHIIKLEKKTQTKGEDGKPVVKYDVRHILVSTQLKDKDSPFAQPTDAKTFVRTKLEREKQTAFLDGIMAKFPVVIEEFEIKPLTAEETAEMEAALKQQMPPGMMEEETPEPATDRKPADAKKPEAAVKAPKNDKKKGGN